MFTTINTNEHFKYFTLFVMNLALLLDQND